LGQAYGSHQGLGRCRSRDSNPDLALTQWTAYIEFRTQTNDSLSALKKKLVISALQSQVSLPRLLLTSAPDIRSNDSGCPQRSNKRAACGDRGIKEQVLATNSTAHVSGRRFLNLLATGQLLNFTGGTHAFATLPNCTDSLPKPMTVKEVLSPTELVTNRGFYQIVALFLIPLNKIKNSMPF